MERVGIALLVATTACSFESFSGITPDQQLDETSSTGMAEATGEADSTSGNSQDANGDSSDPNTQTSMDATTSLGGESTAGGADDPAATSSGGPDVDCSTPVVVSMLAEDAELFPPMSLGTYLGVTYAYSEFANDGEARFTFDVECPSMYRLFARVLDDDPGTHTCCDPDSFRIEGPGGIDTSWFYGCDSTSSQWSWLQIESGQPGGSCDDPQTLVVPLTAGTHQFTFHNREAAFFGAHASLAEVVLTNDPDYAP